MQAGIDVSKNWVDVSIAESGERLERASPLKAAKWLRKRGVTLVALEATGGYELPVMQALERERIPVARANPRQVRRFAQALGRNAKTDSIDAAVLARYAQMLRPEPTALPARAITVLRSLCARRRDLVAMRTAERNRRQQASDAWIIASIDALLEQLSAQIGATQDAITRHLAAHPQLDALCRRLRTMPGIGPVTAAMLIACMPELGHARRTEIAALAGLAPFARESGTWKGRSFCCGGRREVRECLYMAAVSASRGNNRFAKTYKEMLEKGKPPKVALVAIMRKMLVTLNAMAKNNNDFIT
jgi:transposase